MDNANIAKCCFLTVMRSIISTVFWALIANSDYHVAMIFQK